MDSRMAASPEHQHRNSLPRLYHLNHHPPPPHAASHPPVPSALPPPPSSATPSNHGGPSPVYPYPPQSAHGPPPSYYPPYAGRSDQTPEKSFSGEASGHVTPGNTSASDYPLGGPPPPIPGTPSQAPPTGNIHQHMDRPHDHSQPPSGHQGSQPPAPPAAPPPPSSIGYPPPAGPGDHPPYYPPHQQQMPHVGPSHMPHMIENGGYAMHHPPPGAYQVQYPPMGVAAYGQVNNQGMPKDKKKGHRAAQACEACRTRKSKCDELRPLCTGCKENGHECIYRDSVPNKIVDKALSAATITNITNMTEFVSTLPNISQDLVDRLERIEQLLSVNDIEPKREDIARRDTPTADSFGRSKAARSVDSPTDHRSMSIHSQSAPARETKGEQQEDRPAGDNPDSAQVFDEHTTAAHKLLYLWPTIQNILRHNCRADYVMSGEARGWLQLDGQGESAKAIPLDDPIDGPAGSDLNIWDQHTNMLDEHRRQEPLLDNFTLDLREETVMTLVERYKTHVHTLHPFLHLPTLRSFATAFVDYHAQSTNSSGGVPSPAGMVNGESRPNKRKRSEAFPYPPRMNDERSLPTAIMYLVLALGRVVDHQSMVPGPAVVGDAMGSMPPPRMPQSASPASNYRPSPSSSCSFGAPTPPAFNNRTSAGSPVSLYDCPTPGISFRRGRSTNVEDIPGLAYYREGCSILGLHADSNDIMVAQARLLAGLYKGQLGRVQESWSWIHDACRVCRYQTRARGLDKGNASEYHYKHSPDSRAGTIMNTVLVTCWSALQLESDILAEMDWPHSGIASIQEVMPYPQVGGSMDYNPGHGATSVMYYYVLQLYLRKRLNYMHNNIYGKSVHEVDIHTLEENEISLDKFRELYDWDDNEPPATNILDARLRGKFYGARYICLRPYLDYVLHAMRERRAGVELANCAKDAFGNVRYNDLKIFQAIAKLPDNEIKRRAQKCIRSAMLSTEAFDGVTQPGKRLIVTNIMGTSHAQFSNMLTLAAAYHSGLDFLTGLITREKMKYLLKRTIAFLGQIRLCCATANEDIRILKMVHNFLFDDADDESASSSFNSTISGIGIEVPVRQ